MTKFEDSDWKELPADIEAAAKVIGYDQNSWDNDKTPAICNKYFKDLTSDQKAAATKLGYTAATWDDSDDNSDSS